MKEYLKGLDRQGLAESGYLVELLQGEVWVGEGTRVYNQSSIISSFLSTLTIQDVVISDLVIEESPIESISTTLEINNLTVEDVHTFTQGSSTSLIQVTSGTLHLSNMNFHNSS